MAVKVAATRMVALPNEWHRMPEKISCKGCGKEILPTTAERTEGFCMPCFRFGAPNPLGLVDLKLREALEHRIVENLAAYDLRKLRCIWGEGGDDPLQLELELSTHENYVILRFDGVFDLYIPGGAMGCIAIKILDTSTFMPEIPAPVRVEHPQGGGLRFWAESVEKISIVTPPLCSGRYMG